jgi:hypothetical protein
MILGVRACVPLSGITSRTRQTHRTTEPWDRGWVVSKVPPGQSGCGCLTAATTARRVTLGHRHPQGPARRGLHRTDARTSLSPEAGCRPGPARSRGARPRRGVIGQMRRIATLPGPCSATREPPAAPWASIPLPTGGTPAGPVRPEILRPGNGAHPAWRIRPALGRATRGGMCACLSVGPVIPASAAMEERIPARRLNAYLGLDGRTRPEETPVRTAVPGI